MPGYRARVGRGYHDNKITNDPCKRWAADDEEWPKKDQEKMAGATWVLKDRPKKRGGVVFLTMAIGNGVSFTVKNCLSESDEK